MSLPRLFVFYRYIGQLLRVNINHKGLQRNANEFAKERRVYKDLLGRIPCVCWEF